MKRIIGWTYDSAFAFFFRELVVEDDVLELCVEAVGILFVVVVVWGGGGCGIIGVSIIIFPVIEDKELLVCRPGNFVVTGGIFVIFESSLSVYVNTLWEFNLVKIFSLFDREMFWLGVVNNEESSSLLEFSTVVILLSLEVDFPLVEDEDDS